MEITYSLYLDDKKIPRVYHTKDELMRSIEKLFELYMEKEGQQRLVLRIERARSIGGMNNGTLSLSIGG